MTSRFRLMGNLKMNGSLALLKEYAAVFKNESIDLLLPYPYLSAGLDIFEGLPIRVGAQTISEHSMGAYTGQVSVAMLADLGIELVMIGHSEVRAAFPGASYAKQLALAADENMAVVFCLGESLDAYRSGQRESELMAQLEDLRDVHIDRLRIAYEPIWSIGTGQVALSEDINLAGELIQKWLKKHFTGNSAEVSLLYGGSVNEKNCFETIANAKIDGFLVGGAALNPQIMLEMIRLCK